MGHWNTINVVIIRFITVPQKTVVLFTNAPLIKKRFISRSYIVGFLTLLMIDILDQ